LQVYDAGRVYEIENYRQERDPNNFKLLVAHRGAMYYNIRQKIYRLTAASTIERLDTPIFEGFVLSGASVGNELHYMVRTPGGYTKTYVFNPETGGTREWFNTQSIGHVGSRTPSSIAAAFGQVWVAPMTLTAANNSTYLAPVIAVNKILPPVVLTSPYFMRTHSYLITSMLDMGYPDLNKLWNRVVVDYDLQSWQDRIDAYYTTEFKRSQVLVVAADDGAGGYNDWTKTVTDGDTSTSETGVMVPGMYMQFAFPTRVKVINVALMLGA
ncbi:unnamed protein product, partial [marine sediment metagenome]